MFQASRRATASVQVEKKRDEIASISLSINAFFAATTLTSDLTVGRQLSVVPWVVPWVVPRLCHDTSLDAYSSGTGHEMPAVVRHYQLRIDEDQGHPACQKHQVADRQSIPPRELRLPQNWRGFEPGE